MLSYLEKFSVFGGEAAKLSTLYFFIKVKLQRFKPRQNIGFIAP